MRYRAVVFATVVLAGCSKAPVTRGESQAVSPTVVEYLLTAAATDFHTHRPPDPLRFRDVRIGHVMTPSGEKKYMLCGQFLPAREAGNAEWTPFATIRRRVMNSGLELKLRAFGKTHRSYGTRWTICRPRCRADSILCDRVENDPFRAWVSGRPFRSLLDNWACGAVDQQADARCS
jgi:hypothetical protein